MHLSTTLITALPLFGAWASALNIPADIDGLERRGNSSPKCGLQGYDKQAPFEIVHRQCDAAQCSALCTKRSKCKSFAIGKSSCRLYSSPLGSCFKPSGGSPYKFYDIACPKQRTPAKTTTSSAKKTTTTCSTTKPAVRTTVASTSTTKASTSTAQQTTTEAQTSSSTTTQTTETTTSSSSTTTETTTSSSSTTTETTTSSSTTAAAATAAPVFRIRARPNTAFPAIGGAFVRLTSSGSNAGAVFTSSESQASQFRLALDPRAAAMETSPGLVTSAADDGYSGTLVALLPSGTSPTGYLSSQLQDTSQYPTIFFQPRSALMNPLQNFDEQTGEASNLFTDIRCERPRGATTGTLTCASGSKTNFATDMLIFSPVQAYFRLVDDRYVQDLVKLELDAVEV